MGFFGREASHVTALKSRDVSEIPDRVSRLSSGPWGELEFVPLVIEPPDEFLPLSLVESQACRWIFEGFTVEAVTALLRRAQLSEEQLAAIPPVQWEITTSGVTVQPPDELVLSLSEKSRKVIYKACGRAQAITAIDRMKSFSPHEIETIFDEVKFDLRVRRMVNKLCFREGARVFFADSGLVLRKLATHAEKVRFVRAICRQESLLIKLHVLPTSNLEDLVRYWAKAPWSKDLRPLLESLARVPDGARVDLVQLLPPIPTANLYTYPFPANGAVATHQDCHWTALNFFRDQPDNRFADSKEVARVLATDYYPVVSDPRYGDIVLLQTASGGVIHSAVFIAADVVYTKNSANPIDPFMFEKIPEMLEEFEIQNTEPRPLKVLYYRAKYY